MTPQIVGVSHKLVFRYIVSGLTHSLSFWVNAVTSSDSTGFDLTNVLSGSTALSDAIAQVEAKVGPCLSSGTTGGTVTLYEYSEGAFIPVYTGSWTPTSPAGTSHSCSQATFFYRGGSNFPWKLILLETAADVPTRFTSDATGVIGTPFGNLSTDVKDTSGPHIGAWAHTKNGHFGFRFISEVGSLNRRVRRDRGLV